MLGLPGLREALETIFLQCDLFLPSGRELYLFAKATAEREAITEILKSGVRAIVVKNGSEGATYYDCANTVRQPAFEVEEVDPTGAGDCFGATFVSCWLRGMAPADALRYAVASGARAVEKQGPMEGASSLADLDTFIANTSARSRS
jgi:sugar/nucleoside kinase (ribokinase family)